MSAAAPAAAPPATRLLNFVVVGNVRAGTGVVQSTICRRPGAICHADLFHPDDAVRRATHESYFGPSANPTKLPEWFVHGLTNPWQYLSREVFARPLRGETAVGTRLVYPAVAALELFTLFAEKYVEGDFCVVHVDRNPVACLVSYKQSERSGVWRLPADSEPNRFPPPISLDVTELTQFCREHLSMHRRIRAACDDALAVRYKDLVFDFQPVMRAVWDFLELEDETDVPAEAGCRRLRNRHFADRVTNWDQVLKTAPSDVRQLMLAEDLY